MVCGSPLLDADLHDLCAIAEPDGYAPWRVSIANFTVGPYVLLEPLVRS